MLARAVATESEANFMALQVQQLVKGEIGASEQQLALAFRSARNAQPTVLFIDEYGIISQQIDYCHCFIIYFRTSLYCNTSSSKNMTRFQSIFGRRDSSRDNSHLVQQLITELDLVTSSSANVMVLAASNRPDLIDPAMLRPGTLHSIFYLSSVLTT
jgi:transitional endoplasmic reticulum ATPase